MKLRRADYEYYRAVRERQGGKRAALSVARKILRRCYHTLRSLDFPDVYARPDPPGRTEHVSAEALGRGPPTMYVRASRPTPALRMPAIYRTGSVAASKH